MIKKAQTTNNEQRTSNKPAFRAPHWENVRRVLVVRLRSIGDTVLTTPSLIALRRFLPSAQIDVLLEDWVAPVLYGFDAVDNVMTVKRGDKKDRLRTMYNLRRRGYDVAFNLHGGTSAGFFTFASGAKYRVGFESYRNRFFYNILAPPASDFWQQEKTHSAEQQLALLGWTGVPVADKPKTHLTVKPELKDFAAHVFRQYEIDENYPFALIHPVSNFETKSWAIENFAEVVKYLYERGIISVAVGTKEDLPVLMDLFNQSPLAVLLHNKTLPEITAMASKAKIFVGNDSGIAHMAAAVNTPSVVIFGSSNVAHWRPWTDAPNEVVTESLSCAPCAGYKCAEFDEPQCIRRITVERVTAALERVLTEADLD
ncbi:MAG: glycosyltransferase family 9 protein [Acidobacteriota bacterium]|nr:glycosyltransferase family 9 protein [Acidobacteriota bacterium]